MKKKVSTKLYIGTFFATLVIFLIALFISNYINEQKTNELKAEEDKITVDILSLEDQADLASSAASCSAVDRQQLNSEFQDLENRLAYMQNQLGTNDPDLARLKRYYALLEIKDYVLQTQLDKQCKQNTVSILYFYADTNCTLCTTQQYMLQAIEQEYPQVKVYTFDYGLDLSAVETLVSLHNIPNNPPIIDIDDKPYAAFQNLRDFQNIVAQEIASSTAGTATSTKTSTKNSRK